jgi:hypothetical protein
LGRFWSIDSSSSTSTRASPRRGSYSNTSWPYDPRLGRQLGNFPITALFVPGAHFDRAIEINLDGYFNLSLLR